MSDSDSAINGNVTIKGDSEYLEVVFKIRWTHMTCLLR